MTQTFAEDLSRVPMSPTLAATLTRAADYARQQAHARVSLEHMLMALTEDTDATSVLKASAVAVERVTADITTHLSASEPTADAGAAGNLGLAPELKRVLEAAAVAAQQGRRQVNGAIVLAAILGEGKSTAAEVLRAQGMTFDAAIKALQRSAQAGPRPVQPAPSAVPAAAAPAPQTTSATPPGQPTPPQQPIRARPQPPAGQPVARPVAPPPSTITVTVPNPEAPKTAPPRPQPPALPPQLPVQAAREAPTTAVATVPTAPQMRPPAPAVDVPTAAPVRQEADAEPPMPPPAEPAPAPRYAPPAPTAVMRPVAGAQQDWDGPTSRLGTPPASMDAPPMRMPPAPALQHGAYANGAPWPVPEDPADLEPPAMAGAVEPQMDIGTHYRPPLAPQAMPPPRELVRQDPAPPAREGAGGQLVENIPRSMRVGVPVTVEVRLVRNEPLAAAGPLASRALTVRLTAPGSGFVVTTDAPETSWIEAASSGQSQTIARWRWTVIPQLKGRRRLQLAVSTRWASPEGLSPDIPMPDQLIEVRVKRNWGRAIGGVASRLVWFALGAGLMLASASLLKLVPVKLLPAFLKPWLGN